MQSVAVIGMARILNKILDFVWIVHKIIEFVCLKQVDHQLGAVVDNAPDRVEFAKSIIPPEAHLATAGGDQLILLACLELCRQQVAGPLLTVAKPR